MIAQIELTNHCNGKCVFCPRGLLTECGVITQDTLDFVLKQVPPDVERIVISGFGEPFAAPIITRLGFIRDRFPNTHISIFSNGTLINNSHVDALGNMGNIDISISLNGHNGETRRRLMGLNDFDHVLSIAKKLREVGIKCAFTMVAFPIVSMDHLVKFSMIPDSKIIQFQSFGGLMYKYNGDPRRSCERKKNWLTFDYTGKQIKCCFDVNGLADCEQCTEGIRI